MKKFFFVSTLIALVLCAQTIWAQTSPLCIDNGISGDGFWEVCPLAGGETRTGNLDPIGAPPRTEIIFDYFHYFDVGADGNAFQLSTTSTTPPPVQSGPNQVTSRGEFQGENGEIQWTAVSSIAPGSPVYQTVLTFSSNTPLGNLRIIQYLDEDIDNRRDDVLVVEGTPGASNFRLRTNDGPQNFGVAHAANYLSASNMTYRGWAAQFFSSLKTAITDSNSSFSITGENNISSTTDQRFPGLDVFGPGDVTSAIAFDVDPTATSASVIFTLGGSPQISSADLSINKTASPDPVQGNTTLSYTLTVRNNGPDPATEVTVQNTLPDGVSLNATPSNCTRASSPNTLTCTLGRIDNNSNASPITINVTPPSNCDGTPFSNTATVSANEVDSTPNNNTAQTSTRCVQQLQIAPPTGNITAGDSITFSASGGAPPYTFRLSTNNSGGTITSQNATTAQYTAGPTTTVVTDMIEVSDSAGFTAVADVSVNPVALPIVPDVVGQTQAAATAMINAVNGLSRGAVTQENSTSVPAGNVISQDPSPGPAPVGSTVALIISRGIPDPIVPDVVGQTQATATTAINNVTGLTVGGITQADSATVPAGNVISQDPNPGPAPVGSTIALVVSLGPMMVPVPDVVGQPQSTAIAQINAGIGISVGDVTQATSLTVTSGNIISQDPGPSLVPEGTAVALVVSSGPLVIAAVDIPNVVDQSETAANAAINAVTGLSVGVITQANSTTVAAGNIISQDPGPGPVPFGSTVALVVSSGNEISVTEPTDAPDATPGDGVCDIGTGACTLRAAIQEANSFAGAQTITLTPDTYILTLEGANEDAAATGDLDITDDVIIESTTGTAADVVITGNAQDRIFDVHPGSNSLVTLHGLTIQGGQITGSTGGGLRNAQGTVVIEESVVTGNQSNGSGGGISHLGGALTLRDTMITNNISQGLGGGLQAQGGTVTIEGTTQFIGNRANFGGGLSVGRANVSVTNTLVEDNEANGVGGGIYKFLSPSDLLGGSPTFDIQLSNATVRNNRPNNCEGNIGGC